LLNVALIGGGYISQNHIAAYNRMDDVQVVAVICRGKEHGEATCKQVKGDCRHFTSIPEAMAERHIDMVDICTPSFLHESYVIEAANAGLHVLCEKPVAFDLESFDRMYNACKKNKVYFMVAQVSRWWPEFMTVKDYIDSKKLGGLHMIYEKRICQHPTWSTWHRDPSKSGGGLYDLNIHDIDYLYTLFGMPKNVYAVGWQSPTGCWNHVVSSFTWADGVKAVCEGSSEMTGPFPFSIELRATGDEGTLNYAMTAGLNINDGEHGSNLCWYPAGSEEPQQIDVEQTDMFYSEIRAFTDAVKNGTEVPVKPEDSRKVLEIVLAIKKSLETGELQNL
jgi:UDP-N-acetylglucosamine 3-dehydrogenase